VSLLARTRPEARNVSYQDVWGKGGDWQAALGKVGLLSAVSQPVVHRSLQILAGMVAGMTPVTFRGKGAQRVEVEPDPVFIDNPSAVFDAYEWRFAATVSLALAGEKMGLILGRDAARWPTQIELVWPERFDVIDNGLGQRPSYRLDGQPVPAEMVWHRRNFTRPGSLRGVDALSNSGLLEVAKAARAFGKDWFEGGTIPGGIVMPAGDPGPEGSEALITKFRQAAKKRRVIVLPKDTKYEQITVNANESQFLETIQQASAEIATALGVPPEWVGSAVSGSSVTYANRDQRLQDLLVTTLNHYIVIWNRSLSGVLPRPQYVRLNTAAVTRSDLKTRLEGYVFAAQVESLTGNRIYTEDEIRDYEDRVPLPARTEPLPPLQPPRKVMT
jgi:HK97 family phage portal protein